MKPDLMRVGYYRYTLWNGKRIRKTAHRLVAEHYLENPDNLPMVNHKDGNKINNHISNLEWCTCSQNTRHAFDTGLRNLDFQYKGPAHNRSLTDNQVRLIRKLQKTGWKRKEIIDLVGCSISSYKRVNRYYKDVV